MDGTKEEITCLKGTKTINSPGRDEGEAKHFGIKSRLKSEGNGGLSRGEKLQ